jgi:hypothetical protein
VTDGDMQKHLDELTEDEREELKAFVRRFHAQVERKTEQLLYELQDPGHLSEEDLQMRAQLLDGYVPLIDDNGELIFRKREELSIQDMQRFAAFLDADAERREREIGDLGDSSENYSRTTPIAPGAPPPPFVLCTGRNPAVLYIRNLIPDDIGIPSPAPPGLSGWGDADFHAGVNFAFWGFSEVRIQDFAEPRS